MVFHFCQNEDINLIMSLIPDHKLASPQRGLKFASENLIPRVPHLTIPGETEERHSSFAQGVGGR